MILLPPFAKEGVKMKVVIKGTVRFEFQRPHL